MPYNVIKAFRQLGISFDDICSLGCCSIDGETELKLTPAGTPEGAKSRSKDEQLSRVARSLGEVG
jgi:hypothetical protein